MRLLVNEQFDQLAALLVVKRITEHQITSPEKPFVLALPTGATPSGMYRYLIKFYQAGKISFKNIVTFNIDEYVGLDKNHPQSLWQYMQENFFRHVDIDAANTHIMNGVATDLAAECAGYEAKIAAYGGIDLLIGGVGINGHVAFNEPYATPSSPTRVETLQYSTFVAHKHSFGNDIDNIPRQGLTLGMKTILESREIMILANGIAKAPQVAQAVDGAIMNSCPLSLLQLHPKTLLLCDELATYELKVKTVKYFASVKDEYQELATDLD